MVDKLLALVVPELVTRQERGQGACCRVLVNDVDTDCDFGLVQRNDADRVAPVNADTVFLVRRHSREECSSCLGLPQIFVLEEGPLDCKLEEPDGDALSLRSEVLVVQKERVVGRLEDGCGHDEREWRRWFGASFESSEERFSVPVDDGERTLELVAQFLDKDVAVTLVFLVVFEQARDAVEAVVTLQAGEVRDPE